MNHSQSKKTTPATPNASLKAALAKLAAAQTTQQTDLAKTLKDVSDAQRTVPDASLTAALAHVNAITHHTPKFDSSQAAWRAGFRSGLEQMADFNLNPWINRHRLFRDSAAERLAQDWRRVEADLWTTIGKVRSQLDEVPPADRERLTNALVHYLRSAESP